MINLNDYVTNKFLYLCVVFFLICIFAFYETTQMPNDCFKPLKLENVKTLSSFQPFVYHLYIALPTGHSDTECYPHGKVVGRYLGDL